MEIVRPPESVITEPKSRLCSVKQNFRETRDTQLISVKSPETTVKGDEKLDSLQLSQGLRGPLSKFEVRTK